MRLPGLLHFSLISVVLVILDQATKAWVVRALEYGERVDVLPVLAWIHVQNPGAAFSFLADAGGWQRWFFVVLALAFSGWLLWDLSRLKRERWMALGHSLVLGGAVGNLIDRLLHGAVTDFVLVHWRGAHFPAFNVADAAITVGAVIWVALALADLIAQRRGNPQA